MALKHLHQPRKRTETSFHKLPVVWVYTSLLCIFSTLQELHRKCFLNKENGSFHNSSLKTIPSFFKKIAISPIFLGISLSVILFSSPLKAQSRVTRYTMDDGLPGSVILDIKKDRDGFLWVYTFGNLCRFDGYDFKTYNVPVGNEEKPLGSIGKLLIDNNKDLWISSFDSDSMIIRYNIEKNILEPFPKESGKLNVFFRDYLFTSDNSLLYWWDSTLIFSAFERDSFKTKDKYALNYLITGPRKMAQLPDGSLWMAMSSGLFQMDTINGTLALAEYSLVTDGAIDNTQRLRQIIHTDSQLLILRTHSLFIANISEIDHQNKQIIGNSISFKSGYNRQEYSGLLHMAYDGVDRFFLRTEKGVFSYSLSNKTEEWLYSEEIRINDLGQGNFAQAMFFDDNILWIGTDQGLVKINVPASSFHLIHPLKQSGESESRLKCNSVLVDDKKRIWIGTAGNGLYLSEPDTGQGYTSFRNYRHNDNNPFSLGGDHLARMHQSASGKIYLSTEVIQIVREEGDSIFFDPVEGPGFMGMISEGSGGMIYFFIANRSLNQPYYSFCYSEKTGKYLPIQAVMGSDTTNIDYFSKSHEGNEYFLAGNRFNRMEGPFTICRRGNDTLVLIQNYTTIIDPGITWNSFRCILDGNDKVKTLWCSAPGNEIIIKHRFSDHQTGKFELIDTATYILSSKIYQNNIHLTGAYVFDIMNDHKGRLWCSTQNGLCCLGPGDDDIQKLYIEDGIPVSQFYWGTAKDDSGYLYFCTVDGVVQFHPDSIHSEPPASTHLVGIKLFNKPVQPGNSSFLNRSISRTHQLKLPHNKNFLSLEYVALDYSNTQKVRYKYKMEGLDPDWVEAGSRRLADYPNLSPGKYRFRVISENSSGIWDYKGASLDIRIMQPLLLRWWVIVIEALLLTALLIFYIRYREKGLRKQAILLKEQVDEKTREVLEQQREVDELKSRFYTNISHEFRTPLTILLGPLEDALKTRKKKVSFESNLLKVMTQNAKRLQRLINQLLDISKIESGKMQLKLIKGDLSEFVRIVASSFTSLAESKNIDFRQHISDFHSEVCFDAEKLEEIIINLLSNAFKFTPAYGIIEFTLKEIWTQNSNEAPIAEITVRDTGIGIKRDQLDKIFERFYRVSDIGSLETEGTGIGLSLSHELVELMHGKIVVESEPGKGTTFRVSIPVSESCFSENEIESITEKYSPQPTTTPLTQESEIQIVEEMEASSLKRERILVIEDNPDLRKYIHGIFGDQYNVLLAENGKAGFDKAIREVPDLIITDIMMPVMGGIELCKKLRAHHTTDHIPIIMLTARADRESKMEGLEVSADDYITKPFDAEMLIARVKNLIRQRKDLIKKFEKEFIFSENTPSKTSPHFSFLRKLTHAFEKKLSDPDFKVSSIAPDMGMSRIQLYRKTFSITGKNPGELLRIIRMKKAAQLLRNNEMNITQVMYQLGMQNPSNFARLFRKYYGVNPGDYKKMKNTPHFKPPGS